jgi:hypothetical protein
VWSIRIWLVIDGASLFMTAFIGGSFPKDVKHKFAASPVPARNAREEDKVSLLEPPFLVKRRTST